MINMETKLRSAVLHVCFQEMGYPAGETECSTCQEPYLPSRWSNLQTIPGRLQSLCVQFPHHGPPPKFPKLHLQTADGSHVSCNGERLIPLRFGSTSYEWSFQLAPITNPILRADFLWHFRRLVDMAGSGSSSTHHHRAPSSHVPPNLLQAKYEFVREDATSPPLTVLYRGPYLVIEPGDKFFKLQIGSKVDIVSIDILSHCSTLILSQ